MKLTSITRNGTNLLGADFDQPDKAIAQVIAITQRVCLGTQMLTALSTSTAASLTVPTGAVCADIQADGGTVRMRRDATAPTATQGWRIDDGMSVTVDSVLASVRLLAVSGRHDVPPIRHRRHHPRCECEL